MSLLREFLFQSYNFMDSIKVPGFNVSFISVYLGLFGTVVSIAILKLIFGLGNSSTGSGRSVRGGNNNNIKVSEKRRYDTR